MENYTPESSLVELLQAHLDNWSSEFETYWGLRDSVRPDDVEIEDWELAKSLDRVGRNLLNSAYALSLDAELKSAVEEFGPGEKPIGKALRLTEYAITGNRLEIELASHALGNLEQARKRLWLLLMLMSERSLSGRAQAFLDRATRLFLWGFDSEVAIVCRAVAEAALEDRVSSQELRRSGHEPDRRGFFGFGQYVQAASALDIVDDDHVEMMHEIRRAGNDAAHAAPGVGPEPLVILLKLTVILDALYPDQS